MMKGPSKKPLSREWQPYMGPPTWNLSIPPSLKGHGSNIKQKGTQYKKLNKQKSTEDRVNIPTKN